jgi:hypothetical protein
MVLFVLGIIWIALVVYACIRTTLDIGKPRPVITPGVAVMTWLIGILWIAVILGSQVNR